MASEKLSVSVDTEVWHRARSLSVGGSPSAIVNEALRRLVAGEQLAALLRELDDEYGPLPDKVVREAEQRWSHG
jgi:hypothetical protein